MPKLTAYIRLMKPRLTFLVILTSMAGYCLAGAPASSGAGLWYTAIGIALACSGSAVLNQYLERHHDARMAHARNRPLVSGTVPPATALNLGILLVLAGVIELYLLANLLTAFLSLLTAFIYIVIYTPMKRVSALCTSLGAISGALPPVAGWAAASGGIGLGAWALFLILFIWQHPHFYAIAWMYRDDYRNAGFKVSPAVHRIVFYPLALIPASFLLAASGLVEPLYSGGAGLIGASFFMTSRRFASSASRDDARMVLKGSVAYLAALTALIFMFRRV